MMEEKECFLFFKGGNKMETKNIIFALLLAISGTLGIVWVVRHLPLPGLGKSAVDEETAAVIAHIDTNDHDLIGNITDENYLEAVLKQDSPIVLKFYAPWCGACKMADQMYPGLAQAFKDDVKFYSVDVTNQDVMKAIEKKGISKKAIQAIPTFVYKHEKNDVHDQTVGLMNPDEMKEHIKKTFKIKN